jgi:hypothetical protein
MNSLTEIAVGTSAILAAITAIFMAWRRARIAVKAGKQDARAFKDAILGRDEIVHPETGVVLAPAVPGIGARMATIETAVVQMADTHLQVEDLRARVSVLEQKDLERAMARTESIEMLRTIESAIRSTPSSRSAEQGEAQPDA